eukprot:10407855-Ditylum_brightwellii.AAC.1
MILAVHSDMSTLSESKARSRAARHFYVAKQNDKDCNNRAVLTLSTIIRHVVASASEAELAALFYNAREAVPQTPTTTQPANHRQQRSAWTYHRNYDAQVLEGH